MAFPTQSFLQFEQIREDMIIMKDGSLRAVLMVSATNFGLKSQDEQEAIIFGFQNFLNSLDFNLQIFVHSRKLNISGYLAKLQELESAQQNDLLRIQTQEYIEFIRSFVETVSIMSKTYYVILPFSLESASKSSGGAFSALGAILPQSKKKFSLDADKFHEFRNQLLQRADFVSQGLRGLGLRSTMLTTAELIELLWGIYNPEKEEVGGVPDIAALNAEA